ncbi:Protein of unknown function DUF3300 [Paracidovorax avenae ATCC 19860]|uniref:DUF3300 domain-containing protein n=1 Tax=Paracidovorax avenae (strain ATCC 19860 / DSM 7227 / CCUG 15838 / JCM 20985 / LMG 2117 / NCPPB 1011) TaxID=643561 RepID=F0QCZ5_PARA1|nr:DUF3300 domain-containing protein [Paracidovorax avenae]ADX45138.1 Protein of unknown function DUF3300 [Paracidovorax avenae ATCC 19860]
MVRDPALPEVAVSARPHRAIWGTAVTCIAAACALAGCERVTTPAPQAAASVPAPEPAASAPAAAAAPAAVPVAYTPPSADVLYQMVAPIALYPDKLVAQVLAGATYPDQVSAAETWLAQNPGLKGSALVNAVDPQPWDPSVKSLTAFPNVLEQMASNLPWTTALGKAYYHDPADVMNAIQAMRARAAHAGTLKSSPRLRVATVEARSLPPPLPPSQAPVALYQGPAVVAPPPTVITIEPAEVQTVYVPRYDPAVVYGTPVAVYPSYRWAVPVQPAPVAVAAGPDPVAVGALAFGAGVLVGALATSHHHGWGWNDWNLHWGPPPPPPIAWGPAPPPPAWGPAVVYRGATYVSNSPTVIENIHNRITVNNRNVYVNAPGQPPGLPAPGAPALGFAGGPAAPVRAAMVPPMGPNGPHGQSLAAALQDSHAAGQRPMPFEQRHVQAPPLAGDRNGLHQPQALMQAPGRPPMPVAPGQPAPAHAFAQPGAAGVPGAPRPLSAAFQNSRAGHGMHPAEAQHPPELQRSVEPQHAAEHRGNPAAPAMASAMGLPPAGLQPRPESGRANPAMPENRNPHAAFVAPPAPMPAPSQRPQMPAEMSMAHALQQPRQMAAPAPHMQQQPVHMPQPVQPQTMHAEPRSMPVAAMHAPQQPALRPAMHEALRESRPAPQQQPPHHGGGHKPHEGG